MGFKLLRKKGPGKNLFDKNKETAGKYINDSGAIVSNASYAYTNLIPVVAGKTYTASLQKVSGSPSGSLRIHAYDSDGVWQQMLFGATNVESATVTIPAGIPYVRVSWWNAEYSTDKQFEEGSTATPYEPYIDYIYKGMVTNENDGKRGKVDLGTLTWSYDATNTRFMSSKVNDMQPLRENGYLAGYSTLNTAPSAASRDKTFCLYDYGTNNPVIFVKDTRFTTAADFKAAMSGKYLYYQRTTDTKWVPPRWSMLYKKEATE